MCTTTAGAPGETVVISGGRSRWPNSMPTSPENLSTTFSQLVIADDVMGGNQRHRVEVYSSVATAILHRNK